MSSKIIPGCFLRQFSLAHIRVKRVFLNTGVNVLLSLSAMVGVMMSTIQKLINAAKVVWIGFCAGQATVVLFLPITICALLSSTGNLAFSISRVWARFMLLTTRVRIKILNREKIQQGQSYIIISNHQSEYDILALVTSLGIQFRWIIKQELRSVPLFGYALYASRNIFIDRSNPAIAIKSIHKGMDRLPKGTSVMFFAEGTRSMDGKIHPFKKGGFIMALERGFPILPVTVNGSRRILPKKSLIFTPGTIEVVVGEPIETSGYTDTQLPELMDKTREVIIAQYNPAYPEKPPV
jgi:1-acyl-sn-glycerol-3-phosphate acyltransferase